MAYVQGFTKTAKDLMASPLVEADGTATPSESLPSDNMLSYLQKSGASYIYLYHHGKTKELRGNSVKAARTEANHNDSSSELTSISVIPTDDTGDASPFHEKPVPLEVAETCAFKKYAWERDTLRQAQILAMKVRIVLSKLVLPVCAHSTVLTKLSKFKLTPIPTSSTSTNNIWLVHCLLEQHGVTLPPSML